MAEFYYAFEPVGTQLGYVTRYDPSGETSFQLTPAQQDMVVAFMDTQQHALQKFLKGIVE